jgi:tetratricopeptide (TPR) repeat protein
VTAADQRPTAAPNIGFHGSIHAKTVDLTIGGPTASSARSILSNILPRELPFIGRNELLQKIGEILADPLQDDVLVLRGQAGVGKSEIAREFARRNRERYPGGTFFVDARPDRFVVELARIGRTWLGLNLPPDFGLEDQALRTLSALSAAPSLLIFDNAQSEATIRPWLPPVGMPCHVLVTSLIDYDGQGWPVILVDPLSQAFSLELIDKMGGDRVPAELRRDVASQAQGLPVQLVPLSRVLRRAVSRGRIASVKPTLSTEAAESFGSVYDQLSSPARMLLHAAARLNYQRIIAFELKQHLQQGFGWSDDEFEKHLDTCVDLAILDGQSDMRMHQLFSAYVRERALTEETPGNTPIIQSQARRVTLLAKELCENPSRSDLASALTTYSIRLEDWRGYEGIFSIDQVDQIGRALIEIGQFDAARSWCEWAVVQKEHGNGRGGIDHESLGTSLHSVGFCFISKGELATAQTWFERAVASKEMGNLYGQVDHESLGKSQHSLGFCLSRAGRSDVALTWFERAVSAKEKGDIRGQIDHQSVSMSLHQVGISLRRTGQFAHAQSWFEQAVARKEQGDFLGRVDHQSVGMSLHQIGICLSDINEFDGARSWFERAVTAKQLGDVHGRINFQSLSLSLHYVGVCLMGVNRFEAAIAWFKRAVTEAEKGDVHGRVFPERIRESRQSMAECLNKVALRPGCPD